MTDHGRNGAKKSNKCTNIIYSKMNTEFKEQELKEIERQLSHPNGEGGIEMAKMMNETNIAMTKASIKALEIANMEHIVELGHGNCDHLSITLEQANGITFCGLEVSETMYTEAQALNKKYVESEQCEFLLYNGTDIPLKDESVHKIMTVNTLYFWEKPLELLRELFRVLKPKGKLVITFAKKEFMKQLPFVQNKFQLYDNDKAIELINQTSFKIIDILNENDVVKSKHGEIVNRAFSVLILEK